MKMKMKMNRRYATCGDRRMRVAVIVDSAEDLTTTDESDAHRSRLERPLIRVSTNISFMPH